MGRSRPRQTRAHTGHRRHDVRAQGQRYFVYSPYVGSRQRARDRAHESNPWTLSWPGDVIARPDQPWERQGGRQILEGPEFLAGPEGRSVRHLFRQRLLVRRLRARAAERARGQRSAGRRCVDEVAAARVRQVAGERRLRTRPQRILHVAGRTRALDRLPRQSGPRHEVHSKRSPRIQRFHWTDDGKPRLDPPIGPGVSLSAPAAE